MQILHCFKVYQPEIRGGIPEVISQLCTGMAPHKKSSVLVARRAAGLHRRHTIDGIPVEAVSSIGTLWSMPLAPAFPFVAAKRSRAFDILALHHPFPLNDVAILLGATARKAIVVHWHAEIMQRRAIVPLVNYFVRSTLARAKRIIIADPSLLENSELLRSHAHKCAVVPFGVDVESWQSLNQFERSQVEELRAKYPSLVVATGRLVPYKGFDTLIRACQHVQATVAIVGEGPLRQQLRDLAYELGVGDRIQFLGNISNSALKTLLHAARIFALPSVTAAEAFGIVQLEAMAVGVPIVNTELPTAVPRVARHGIEALTVRPGDPRALASAIDRLLNDGQLAEQFRMAGRVRAQSEYRKELFIRRIEKVYDDAAGLIC